MLKESGSSLAATEYFSYIIEVIQKMKNLFGIMQRKLMKKL